MASKKKFGTRKKILSSLGSGVIAPDVLLNKGQGIIDFSQALLPFLFNDGG